jgi:hypothetical protein
VLRFVCLLVQYRVHAAALHCAVAWGDGLCQSSKGQWQDTAQSYAAPIHRCAALQRHRIVAHIFSQHVFAIQLYVWACTRLYASCTLQVSVLPLMLRQACGKQWAVVWKSFHTHGVPAVQLVVKYMHEWCPSFAVSAPGWAEARSGLVALVFLA